MSATHFQTFIDAYEAVEEGARDLGGDFVLCPPSEDFGYESTPQNAVTFATMGVDGVHYAILMLDGVVRDDSPVVCVSPMDSKDVFVLANSMLEFLADGCKSSPTSMKRVLADDCAGASCLVAFLANNFVMSRLLGERRTDRLTNRLGHLIQRKPSRT